MTAPPIQLPDPLPGLLIPPRLPRLWRPRPSLLAMADVGLVNPATNFGQVDPTTNKLIVGTAGAACCCGPAAPGTCWFEYTSDCIVDWSVPVAVAATCTPPAEPIGVWIVDTPTHQHFWMATDTTCANCLLVNAPAPPPAPVDSCPVVIHCDCTCIPCCFSTLQTLQLTYTQWSTLWSPDAVGCADSSLGSGNGYKFVANLHLPNPPFQCLFNGIDWLSTWSGTCTLYQSVAPYTDPPTWAAIGTATITLTINCTEGTYSWAVTAGPPGPSGGGTMTGCFHGANAGYNNPCHDTGGGFWASSFYSESLVIGGPKTCCDSGGVCVSGNALPDGLCSDLP